MTIIEGSLYTGGSTKQLAAAEKFETQREISNNTVILRLPFELIDAAVIFSW